MWKGVTVLGPRSVRPILATSVPKLMPTERVSYEYRPAFKVSSPRRIVLYWFQDGSCFVRAFKPVSHLWKYRCNWISSPFETSVGSPFPKVQDP